MWTLAGHHDQLRLYWMVIPMSDSKLIALVTEWGPGRTCREKTPFTATILVLAWKIEERTPDLRGEWGIAMRLNREKFQMFLQLFLLKGISLRKYCTRWFVNLEKGEARGAASDGPGAGPAILTAKTRTSPATSVDALWAGPREDRGAREQRPTLTPSFQGTATVQQEGRGGRAGRGSGHLTEAPAKSSAGRREALAPVLWEPKLSLMFYIWRSRWNCVDNTDTWLFSSKRTEARWLTQSKIVAK